MADRWTIILERHLLANINAGACRVPVLVSDRRRQCHQIGNTVQADAFAGIWSQKIGGVLMHRTQVSQRHSA